MDDGTHVYFVMALKSNGVYIKKYLRSSFALVIDIKLADTKFYEARLMVAGSKMFLISGKYGA